MTSDAQTASPFFDFCTTSKSTKPPARCPEPTTAPARTPTGTSSPSSSSAPGQSGLDICPGREVVTSFGMGDQWTKIHFAPGDIVCNIGGLLMSWSDDRFKSTFHRVKAPTEPGDYYGPRYSIAFLNQPCVDCEIQGPRKNYPMVTGAEFTKAAMERNFAALKAKKEELGQQTANLEGSVRAVAASA